MVAVDGTPCWLLAPLARFLARENAPFGVGVVRRSAVVSVSAAVVTGFAARRVKFVRVGVGGAVRAAVVLLPPKSDVERSARLAAAACGCEERRE